ncbi:MULTISPECIES: TetR family transcriptional regulator [unclassified Acidisoma]|jgi:ubiquinone biosynthesis protein COQ9|uniref:TetR family transcriptional regulator n=1 Tax=unclassified Acidisoma TaxID=2634065 RepID=UPI00131D8BD8|nr:MULTISPECIES: TetR family transcriptional regulator [unclassified Acidisoma]
MNDAEFDEALVAAVFAQAGDRGWRSVSLVQAARDAGLDVARTRTRFPSRIAVLMRFGAMADRAALEAAPPSGPIKDRLFDMIMRRIDVLQAHRAGVLAVLEAAPRDPLLGLMLSRLSLRSMGWLLEAAEVSTTGLRGAGHKRGLLAVWLWVVRAWRNDDSTDLATTMSALDQALDRAAQVARWLGESDDNAPPDPESASDTMPPDEPPPVPANGAVPPI